MLNRRKFVARSCASVAACSAGMFSHEPSLSQTPSAFSRAVASERIPFGAAVNLDPLKRDGAYRNAMAKYCDLVVPEGALKWAAVRPAPDRFDFSDADFILDFAKRHGIAMRGHTLVWYAALPDWVNAAVSDARIARAELTSHIGTVVNRYRDTILSWDVLNEPLADDPAPERELRPSIWMQHLGPDYIELAFRAAHEANPAAELYLNEFDVEYAGPRYDAKRKALIALARTLRDRGVPIHGIGIQGHLESSQTMDHAAIRRLVAAIRDMGLQVMITEMDVLDEKLPGDPIIRDRSAADLVAQFLGAVCDVVRPAAIVTWGLSDKYSWVPTVRKREDKLANRPLPLDNMMRPKEMFAVIEKFRGRQRI
jgi:endo-1,4-beta-xylanase